ncbi:MAG TPA: hypothetical protein VGG39_15930 [Polyangiaceae bacterium]|jgi:hypothetical protein
MRTVNLPGGDVILYGQAPYGWRLSADRSYLVPDPDEQRILSVVRHLYLSERLSVKAIAEYLRRTRMLNRRGLPFSASGVSEKIHRRTERPAEAKPPKAGKRRRGS